MTSFKELQKKLAEYTSGLLPVEEFRAWFAPVLRDVHRSGDADAEKLAHAVEWEFCDLERGVSSDAILKENLSRLARVAVAVSEPTNSPVQVQRQELFVSSPTQQVLVQAAGNDNYGNSKISVATYEQGSSNESSVTLELTAA